MIISKLINFYQAYGCLFTFFIKNGATQFCAAGKILIRHYNANAFQIFQRPSETFFGKAQSWL
ncbi:hypothetical protein PL75_09050 [Neisseria arctica]|uniref:Uncharacterized protein n=1 Tax=Neisseria arctica TaxID=1470200 RepID=A0A0J0YQ80_9NEIS|nr:hypothetical protein PL75_09050 [Neisseria arctica]